MKRTIIAVISIVLIAFAFTACRQSVVIPYDPTPSNPNTPSGPSVPDDTIQVGDKTYKYLEDAIAEAAAGSTIEIGAGEYRVASAIPVPKDITIVGAGIDKTFITVSDSGAFTVTGSDSFKISNLTISDESTNLTNRRSIINVNSSSAVFESIKMTGEYTSTGNVFGIVSGANTATVSITDSKFDGFRVPFELDCDSNEFTATVTGNEFNNFDKITIEYRDGVTVEDNTFSGDTDESFQISLDWRNGAITPEQAMAVAKANDCVVQVLRTGLIYDAEGFVISDLEGLKSFASGKAGSIAKLIAPIKVTESITFIAEANNLSLNGNIDFSYQENRIKVHQLMSKYYFANLFQQ